MQIPTCYQVKTITQETSDVFTLVLANEETGQGMAFRPGQFNMLYRYGVGEAAISIAGDPVNKNSLTHTIRSVGSVTRSLQQVKPGDIIGVRGPFGSCWPLEKKNCDVLVIAGGIGLAALHSTLHALSKYPQDYRTITLLYGTRTIDDLLYQKEIDLWKSRGIHVAMTLDKADIKWKGNVGVVTTLIRRHLTRPNDTLVLICGPEIMMQFTLHELMAAQVKEENIYLSMERNMQCATAFCGHCQYGPYFVCKDGPVFSYPQVKKFLTIKEI